MRRPIETEMQRIREASNLALHTANFVLPSLAALQNGSSRVDITLNGEYEVDPETDEPTFTTYWLAGDIVGSAPHGP